MNIKIRLLFPLILAIFFSLNCENLLGIDTAISIQKLTVNDCLLPADHPLQKKLNRLFKNGDMFDSPRRLKQAGFQVIARVHRGLMVAGHPSMKKYLIKKFQNHIPQNKQLENYLQRINGARALSSFIKLNHLKHVIVPEKWLYALPDKFSDPETKEQTYLLIVEKMDICSGGKDPNGEVAQRYYTIDLDILREICIVVYYFRGLDSMLHNLPFTYQNKIAFIDTEKWDIDRQWYFKRIMPFLRKDRQDYALSVFEELSRSLNQLNLQGG